MLVLTTSEAQHVLKEWKHVRCPVKSEQCKLGCSSSANLPHSCFLGWVDVQGCASKEGKMWGQELAELGWIWASLVLRQVNVFLLANEVVLISVMPKIPKMWRQVLMVQVNAEGSVCKKVPDWPQNSNDPRLNLICPLPHWHLHCNHYSRQAAEFIFWACS